jgi:hypothetical protein
VLFLPLHILLLEAFMLDPRCYNTLSVCKLKLLEEKRWWYFLFILFVLFGWRHGTEYVQNIRIVSVFGLQLSEIAAGILLLPSTFGCFVPLSSK